MEIVRQIVCGFEHSDVLCWFINQKGIVYVDISWYTVSTINHSYWSYWSMIFKTIVTGVHEPTIITDGPDIVNMEAKSNVYLGMYRWLIVAKFFHGLSMVWLFQMATSPGRLSSCNFILSPNYINKNSHIYIISICSPRLLFGPHQVHGFDPLKKKCSSLRIIIPFNFHGWQTRHSCNHQPESIGDSLRLGYSIHRVSFFSTNFP